MNNHVIALLLHEIKTRLKELERRGIGCIEDSYPGSVEYRIDDTVFEIIVKAKRNNKKSIKKGEKV